MTTIYVVLTPIIKHSKATYRFRMSMKKVACIVITILSHHITSAQTTHYLSQVGLVDSLYSEILGEWRGIFIQLPNGYEMENEKKYPVAYIIDGEVLLPTASNIHDFYSGGFMPEMIFVGISNAENRTRDLTPSKIATKYGMPFSETNGESQNFRKFFQEELIPYVEQKYRATNYRTLIGHSYGGLFTIYTLLNSPHLFANYVSIDPSLDWDDQLLLRQATTLLPKMDLTGKSLYISLSGQLHMQNPSITIDNVMQDTTDFTVFTRSNISFSNLVKANNQNGLLHEWQFYPNDIHGTIAQPSMRDGLLETFKWFQMEHTDKINSFDTPLEELLSIINHRAAKLKSHFGYDEPAYPEELLNMSGYMNLDMDQPEKAKMYFEQTIRFYPESANAYDSMADYYLAQKDNAKALKFVEKAFAISESDYHRNKIEELRKE